MFNLAKEHSLTKAGLRRVHIVETAELGLRPGDIVFEFPFGRIVDTGMACRRDGIIPPDVDIMTIHKEAAAIRAACNRKAQEEEQLNVLLLGERFRFFGFDADTGSCRLAVRERDERGRGSVIFPWRALAASPSAPGTGSSNPSPSSGESCANLTRGEGADRRQAQPTPASRGTRTTAGIRGRPDHCPSEISRRSRHGGSRL